MAVYVTHATTMQTDGVGFGNYHKIDALHRNTGHYTWTKIHSRLVCLYVT